MARRASSNPLDDDLDVGGSSSRGRRVPIPVPDPEPLPTTRRRKTTEIEENTYRRGRQQDDDEEGVYVIRSITETDMTDWPFTRKLFDGIPLSCNYRYTMTLVNMEGAAHGKKGQNLNATIWGKIEDANVEVQDHVQVQGKRRGKRFVISKLYDYDAQEYIRINKFWRSATAGKNGGRAGAGGMFLLLALLLMLVAGVWFVTSFMSNPPKDFMSWVKIIIAVALVVAYLVLTKFSILNSPLMQKIIIGGILVFIVLYVLRGSSLFVGALTIWVLYRLLKKII